MNAKTASTKPVELNDKWTDSVINVVSTKTDNGVKLETSVVCPIPKNLTEVKAVFNEKQEHALVLFALAIKRQAFIRNLLTEKTKHDVIQNLVSKYVPDADRVSRMKVSKADKVKKLTVDMDIETLLAQMKFIQDEIAKRKASK